MLKHLFEIVNYIRKHGLIIIINVVNTLEVCVVKMNKYAVLCRKLIYFLPKSLPIHFDLYHQIIIFHLNLQITNVVYYEVLQLAKYFVNLNFQANSLIVKSKECGHLTKYFKFIKKNLN